ncbi:serine/threonine protein kinase [Bacillus sp. APMAM]|nr:serine/threonine protein kinase [Bacillus sp. APMAM]
MVQNIDGINYELQEPFDMSFLSSYGKVFRVFDKQDSGCICFGVQNKGKKLFVKFAGAKPVRFKGAPQDAISGLKAACKVYEDLRHKNLVFFIKGENIGNGYATIFEWTDAECMGKQYDARDKFFELPVDDRIHIFKEILVFHQFVSEKGYVAIDFYDGSIMYDFTNKKTIICDIDSYSKMPYINSMGRMWGSSRFMSPEEFEKNAVIDEVTNVYLMGATAFALLGDAAEKTFQKWNADKVLFEVAKKAVSNDRSNRYQSIEEFIAEWTRAKNGKFHRL